MDNAHARYTNVKDKMRFIVSFIVLIMPLSSYAWECGEYDRYNQSLEKHLELASDVIIGDVVRGEVGKGKKYGYDVELTFRPTLIIKGNTKGDVTLHTSSQPPFDRFELAGTYAIFLYGSNEVSFCSMVLPFWVSISTKQDLEEYISRKDIQGAVHYKPLLEYVKP